MPLAEEKALEILTELIKKQETKTEDIPRIWSEILDVYNKAYAPVVEAPAKKKRRRGANPNIGWPQGVKRAEYNAWKASLKGTDAEVINPQEFKRLKEAGLIDLSSLTAKTEPKKAAASKAEKANGGEAKPKAEKATKSEAGKAGGKAGGKAKAAKK